MSFGAVRLQDDRLRHTILSARCVFAPNHNLYSTGLRAFTAIWQYWAWRIVAFDDTVYGKMARYSMEFVQLNPAANAHPVALVHPRTEVMDEIINGRDLNKNIPFYAIFAIPYLTVRFVIRRHDSLSSAVSALNHFPEDFG